VFVAAGITLGPIETSSDVTEIAKVADDTGLFSTLLKSNFAQAKDVYTKGYNSCAKTRKVHVGGCDAYTLQNFSKYRAGDPYSEAYKAYYGSGDSWDGFIVAALDGSGKMASKNDVFRATAAAKSALGITTAMVHDGLERAMTLGKAGQIAAAQVALDESWAFYYGFIGKNTAYMVGGKRDVDFPNGINTKVVVPALYKQAQAALSPFDAKKLSSAVDFIYKLVLVTFVRCAIKYTFVSQKYVLKVPQEYSAKYHAEAYAYSRVVLGYIAKFDKAAADVVENANLWTVGDARGLKTDMHCKAKAALEGAYHSLGLDCAMVGNFKDPAANLCSKCSTRSVQAVPVFGFPSTTETKYDALGPYSHMTDVKLLADLSQDMKTYSTATGSNFTLALEVYKKGMAVPGHSVQEWSAPSPGSTYFDAFSSYYSNPKSWEDLIISSLSGSGVMATKNDVFRGIIAKKAILGLAHSALHDRLDLALKLGKDSKGTSFKAVAAVDQAWALLYGKASLSGKSSPYVVSGKRDIDFYNGTQVKEVVGPLFQQAQGALHPLTYDASKASEAVSGIYRALMITFIRCAIKYSYTTQKSLIDKKYSAKYHAEVYVYWRTISAYVATIDKAAADIVEDSIMWSKAESELKDGLHCRVKNALEAAYASLGVDCSMVGEFKGYKADICGTSCVSGAVKVLPLGNPQSIALPVLSGSEQPVLGVYPPMTDVKAVTNLGTAAFTAAFATNLILAKEIYTKGLTAVGYTLQGLDAAYPGGRRLGAYYEAYKLYYSSPQSWADITLSALSGTGGMAGKSAVFRQTIGQLAAIGVMTMALLERLDESVKLVQAGKNQDAMKSWDEAWALYHGVDGTNAPYTVSGNQDSNFPTGALVNGVLPKLFLQGQKHLESQFYDLSKVVEAKEGIYRSVLTTYVRATVQSAYSLKTKYSDKDHAQAYMYWRAISPYVAKVDKPAFDIVEDMLLWSKAEAALKSDLQCQVKQALEGAYAALKLDCTIVGDFNGHDFKECAACAVPVVASLPAGAAFTRSSKASAESCSASASKAAPAPAPQVFCTTGEEFDGIKCAKCRAGKYNPQSDGHCHPCSAGRFAEKAAAFECQTCPQGSFSGGDVFAAKTECTLCPPGMLASAMGSNTCSNCSAGSFNNVKGGKVCNLCDIGTYASSAGSTQCASCPQGKSTKNVATQKVEMCQCPEQSYMVLRGTNTFCQSCPEGMTCSGFGAKPLLKVGFYTMPGTSLTQDSIGVFKCMTLTACPGQSLASDPVCAANYDPASTNCGRCKEEFFAKDGKCEPCGDSNGAILPIVAVALFFVFGAIHFVLDWTGKREADRIHTGGRGNSDVAGGAVLLSVTVGVAVFKAQAMAVLQGTEVEWPSGFKNILEVSRLLLVDLSGLRMSCMVRPTLASSYTTRVFLPFVVIAFALAWMALSRLMTKINPRFPRFELAGMINTVGGITQALYIGLVASVVSLIECYPSPDGSKQIRGYPYVTCGSSDHHAMIPVMIFGLLAFVVGIITAFAYLIYMVPFKYQNRDFQIMVRFLVIKYSPSTFWFSLVFIARSFCLAMVTVVEAERGFMQLVWLQVIMVLFLIGHVSYSPYRFQAGNRLETCVMSLIIIMLAFSSWFAQPGVDKTTDFSKSLSTAIMSIFSLVVVILAYFIGMCAFKVFTKKDIHEKYRVAAEYDLANLQAIAMVISDQGDAVKALMFSASYMDRYYINQVTNYFQLELLGLKSKQFGNLRLPRNATNFVAATPEALQEHGEASAKRFATGRAPASDNQPDVEEVAV